MHIVDVVIPTMGRPSLLQAVASVRAQVGVEVRLHVVLDEPSAEPLVRSMAREHEVIVTTGRTGGAHARNLGLRESRGRFVAYLDDDDWWESGKLLAQCERMVAEAGGLSLCGAIFHERGGGTRVLPRSAPSSASFGDYIVTRPDLTYGRSLVQSSCLVIDRERASDIEWDSTMPKHQDWDYALRLERAGASVSFEPQPLVHIQQGSSGSVSNLHAWMASREWYERHAPAMTARGRGDFVASHVLRSALAVRSGPGLRYSLGALVRNRPHAAALVSGLRGAMDAMPSPRRREARASR